VFVRISRLNFRALSNNKCIVEDDFASPRLLLSNSFFMEKCRPNSVCTEGGSSVRNCAIQSVKFSFIFCSNVRQTRIRKECLEGRK
jgi:hypothetical protein